MIQFEGIWVPIVTPFQHGEVDLPALASLARHLVTQGAAGLILGATTGEGGSLSCDERIAMVDHLRGCLPAHIPLVVGLNEMHTEACVAHAKTLAACHPDGLMLTPPPYVRAAQAGIQQHFERVTEAADLPVVIYDIPYRTASTLELATLQALARDPRIAAIKVCGATMDRLTALIEDTPLAVMIGEDSQFFAALCLGAAGAITASAHCRADLWVKVFRLLQEQKLSEARVIAARLQTVVRTLFAEPNPTPIKAYLAQQGLMSPELRLPMVAASDACLEAVCRAVSALEPVR